MDVAQGRIGRRILWLAVLILACAAGWYARSIPLGKELSGSGSAEHADDPHQGHNHGPGGVENTLELSPQALQNIGLQIAPATLSSFERRITIPGMVVQQPGRTSTRVVAPLTGIISRVHVIAGEALAPGKPLFDLRLTHEDLVQAQVDFLKTLEERDVALREIARLKPLYEKGIIPQKTLLEREYEQDRLNASYKAQRQALLLHGLSAAQVQEILERRQLISQVTVLLPEGGTPLPRAIILPVAGAAPEQLPATACRIVEELKVQPGQLVAAGDTLCLLADLSQLYIEGKGFEQDAAAVLGATGHHWKLVGVLEMPGQPVARLEELEILYVADKVDPESRTFSFYIRLSNQVQRDNTQEGHRFLNWRFKPGQRVQLLVPVERWERKLVFPATAVAQDGVETYVFVSRGGKLERRAVQLLYHDRTQVVLQSDGAVFPGEEVALTGASQLQMALKNKASGPLDLHAGHHH